MCNFDNVECVELSSGQKEDMKNLYRLLFIDSVEKRSEEDQEAIFQEYVKPVLDLEEADEKSYFRFLYEGFVYGVNAGAEFADFVHQNNE